MEHDLVLRGKVVSPSAVEEFEVGVDDGRISELKRSGLKGGRRIDAGRCLIFPGFVDIHVHLREPGWEHKEDFRTGTLAAAHGGVTTVVDMPNNPVPATTAGAIEEKRRLARAKALVDVKFYGGLSAERLGDAPGMSRLVVGYKVYLARSTGELAFPEERLGEALEVVRGTGLPVSFHCEDQKIIDARAKRLEGVSRPDAYCDVRPPESETESVSKVVASLKGSGVRRANVCHASTKGALDIAERARADGMDVRCEAALHHLFFDRRAALENPLLKTNPPLRQESDRHELVKGLSDGRASFLVTDHAPHTPEEKSEGLSGVPGLDDYAHVASWLVTRQGVRPEALCRAASYNPARFAAMDDKGEVAVGKVADFTVLDLDSPERVRGDRVESKCGWSPYEGVEFPGRAKWTIRAGEALLDDYELVV